jgi:hypothetical protein
VKALSEEEKRRKYLDIIKKRAEDNPQLWHIIEETKSHEVELSEEPKDNKNKKEKDK